MLWRDVATAGRATVAGAGPGWQGFEALNYYRGHVRCDGCTKRFNSL